jgi:hypothetical protein
MAGLRLARASQHSVIRGPSSAGHERGTSSHFETGGVATALSFAGVSLDSSFEAADGRADGEGALLLTLGGSTHVPPTAGRVRRSSF